jgi:hypothetical protein
MGYGMVSRIGHVEWALHGNIYSHQGGRRPSCSQAMANAPSRAGTIEATLSQGRLFASASWLPIGTWSWRTESSPRLETSAVFQ